MGRGRGDGGTYLAMAPWSCPLHPSPLHHVHNQESKGQFPLLTSTWPSPAQGGEEGDFLYSTLRRCHLFPDTCFGG